MSRLVSIHHALIKTHHMTSRKKIAALADSANRLSIEVMIRTGGYPGIMYVAGPEGDVRSWIEVVRVSDSIFKYLQACALFFFVVAVRYLYLTERREYA